MRHKLDWRTITVILVPLIIGGFMLLIGEQIGIGILLGTPFAILFLRVFRPHESWRDVFYKENKT